MEWIINGFLSFVGIMKYPLIAFFWIMLFLMFGCVLVVLYEFIKSLVYSVKNRIYEKSLTDRN